MRRSGATLLEVLVAIFVMGIGLLALLTLFPLGALRMYKAIQDQRAFEVGIRAESAGVIMGVRTDGYAAGTDPQYPKITDPFQNPDPTLIAGGNQIWQNAATDGPSYPVLMDPIGWYTATLGSNSQKYVGASGLPNPASGPWYGIARRRVQFAQARADVLQWFTSPDDVDWQGSPPGTAGEFGNVATPRLQLPPPYQPANGGNPRTFLRDIRFSYAYLVQRPRYGDQSVYDTSIVVFNKRPLSLSATLSLPEYFYPTDIASIAKKQAPQFYTQFFFAADGTQNPPAAANTIRINYGAGNVPPPARIGDWILDATPVPLLSPNTAHGYFYRVVGVTDQSNFGPIVDYEVELPIRGTGSVTTGNPPTAFLGTAIILDGVAEVFHQGTTRLP